MRAGTLFVVTGRTEALARLGQPLQDEVKVSWQMAAEGNEALLRGVMQGE